MEYNLFHEILLALSEANGGWFAFLSSRVGRAFAFIIGADCPFVNG